MSSCETWEEAVRKGLESGAQLAEGVEAIHELIAHTGGAFCFRDHWRYWRDQGEVARAGKLVTLGDDEVLFMDDNARDPDGHIVDARFPGGDAIPWPEARRSVVRAFPIAAITDPDYFSNLIFAAVRRAEKTIDNNMICICTYIYICMCIYIYMYLHFRLRNT